MRIPMTFMLVTALAAPAFGAGNHDHHAVPTLQGQTTTAVTVQGNTVTLTFGPIDLPAAHEGDLAASMPKHIFELPWSATSRRSSQKKARRFHKTTSIIS